jgi:plastocyanin
MKRLAITLMAVAALLAPGAAYGQATEITTGDDFFAPRAVTSTVGSSFHWAWGPGAPSGSVNEHNVRQDDKLFYSGPYVVSGEFSLTPSAGSFHYYCELHGTAGGGMDGELRIKPTATVSGNRATIAWATATTDSGRQFDVRQKVGKKKPKLVRQATGSVAGTFKLKPGTRYQFQARSRQGKATSGWSPKLKLKG